MLHHITLHLLYSYNTTLINLWHVSAQLHSTTRVYENQGGDDLNRPI